MRHHMYNPDFKFEIEPEHFNKYTDRELLQYCLGATMYMPGFKDFPPKILNHAIETNAAMSSIVTKANCAMDAQALSDAMRQGSNNKYGIETTDEVQKY